jgi:hypothetical protein
MLGKEVAELRRGDSLSPGAAPPQMRRRCCAGVSSGGIRRCSGK